MSRRRTRLAAAVLLACVVAGCTGPPLGGTVAENTPAVGRADDTAISSPESDTGAPARPTTSWSLTAGRLVYEVHRGERVNIYRYDAGAAEPVALTTHGATDGRPKWSPDGSRILYFSNVAGSDDVWVMNADGSEARRLTDYRGREFDPEWMPDGRHIVFASDRDGDENLWLLDLESGALRQLTHYEGGRTGAPAPTVDGRSIVFTSDQVFSWQIYRLALGSGEIERLTGPLPGNCNPAVNPRTGRIAYMSGGNLIGTGLRSMAGDGSDKRDLGSGRGDNHDPQFSSDGARLVWAREEDGAWDLWEAAADGAGERRVTTTPEDERHPDPWIPGASHFGPSSSRPAAGAGRPTDLRSARRPPGADR